MESEEKGSLSAGQILGPSTSYVRRFSQRVALRAAERTLRYGFTWLVMSAGETRIYHNSDGPSTNPRALPRRA